MKGGGYESRVWNYFCSWAGSEVGSAECSEVVDSDCAGAAASWDDSAGAAASDCTGAVVVVSTVLLLFLHAEIMNNIKVVVVNKK